MRLIALGCRQFLEVDRPRFAIEDSLNGIRSAHAAGLHPVMVIDKVQPTEEIKKMCTAIFDSLEGLKTIL